MLDWILHSLDPIHARCGEWCLHFWEVIGIWFTGAATVGAVYAALFGEVFKARWVRLIATIENRHGVLTPIWVPADGYRGQGPVPLVEIHGRYYQMRISNLSARFPAHQVSVWLTRLDHLGPEGAIAVKEWIGEVPLIWQHRDQFPGPRTIGAPANVDVFTINDRGVLRIQDSLGALNLPAEHRTACRLQLTVQIRSAEKVFEDIRLLVEWNGEWSSDAAKMCSNVVFKRSN